MTAILSGTTARAGNHQPARPTLDGRPAARSDDGGPPVVRDPAAILEDEVHFLDRVHEPERHPISWGAQKVAAGAAAGSAVVTAGALPLSLGIPMLVHAAPWVVALSALSPLAVGAAVAGAAIGASKGIWQPRNERARAQTRSLVKADAQLRALKQAGGKAEPAVAAAMRLPDDEDVAVGVPLRGVQVPAPAARDVDAIARLIGRAERLGVDPIVVRRFLLGDPPFDALDNAMDQANAHDYHWAPGLTHRERVALGDVAVSGMLSTIIGVPLAGIFCLNAPAATTAVVVYAPLGAGLALFGGAVAAETAVDCTRTEGIRARKAARDDLRMEIVRLRDELIQAGPPAGEEAIHAAPP